MAKYIGMITNFTNNSPKRFIFIFETIEFQYWWIVDYRLNSQLRFEFEQWCPIWLIQHNHYIQLNWVFEYILFTLCPTTQLTSVYTKKECDIFLICIIGFPDFVYNVSLKVSAKFIYWGKELEIYIVITCT